MDTQSISFAAQLPASGFHWIHKGADGQWHATEPPEDWPEAVYEAARELTQPKLTKDFYIAAIGPEIVGAGENSAFGVIKNIPDLYLSFASERPTPRRIQDYANKFGLLRFHDSKLRIPRKNAADLEQALNYVPHPLTFDDPEFLYFYAESAADWLLEFEVARSRLRKSPSTVDIRDAKQVEEVNTHLFLEFVVLGGTFKLHLELDTATGLIRSNLIASSLSDLLQIQYGTSITANVLHRQCQECPTWFSVHPATGRPEKIFCSDACRMRAYRRRLRKAAR